MNFGKMDRYISIEQYSNSRTTSGAVKKTWTKLADIWAQIEYKTGGEKFEANQEQGFNTVEFTTRFCAAINANEKQRILYNSEYFDIIYVNVLERDKYYKLITKRKTVWQEQ